MAFTILMILIVYLGGNVSYLFPILFVIFITFATNQSFSYKFLSTKLLVFFGKISYSMYIFHILLINTYERYFALKNNYFVFIMYWISLTAISYMSYLLFESLLVEN